MIYSRKYPTCSLETIRNGLSKHSLRTLDESQLNYIIQKKHYPPVMKRQCKEELQRRKLRKRPPTGGTDGAHLKGGERK